MFTVYVLQSLKSGKYYVGQTEDLENRLRKHNWGESRSTKAGRPWEIVYAESFETRTEAIKRERFLKSPQGWKTMVQIKSERGAAPEGIFSGPVAHGEGKWDSFFTLFEVRKTGVITRGKRATWKIG